MCTSKGLSAVKIVGTDAGAAARLQLDQGRAQLAVQGNENLAYFAKKEPGKYQIVLTSLLDEPEGIAVKKDNMALTKAIQETLKKMYDDGTSKKIQAEYGLKGIIDPTINAGK
ncbi:type 2 periplasmic-binding domain-containing protein [Streptomyces sp. NPDC001312]|uniref:hypothetical protein n=1 Tax=Streptomyces sp. NPDC001312 TaxID=3364561 RepID=UPI003673C00C